MAYDPVLLPDRAKAFYESQKLLTISNIKNEIKFYLEKRKPSDIQTGV
jgi:hypothetical protein